MDVRQVTSGVDMEIMHPERKRKLLSYIVFSLTVSHSINIYN